MTMVWSDPAGFAVDWDWQRGLTVWALAGQRSEPRFDGKVLEHELPARTASERQAQAAGCWWRTQGRAETLAVFGGSASSLSGDPGSSHPSQALLRISASYPQGAGARLVFDGSGRLLRQRGWSS